jgi:uncharacterized membrane-anchored protein
MWSMAMTLLDRLRRLLWADSTNLTYQNRPESADPDKFGSIIPADETTAILAAAERVPDAGRRKFLKLALAGVAVAATVDVDQLLWTPDKTFLLPSEPAWQTFTITDHVWSDAERDIAERYIRPAMQNLARAIDDDLARVWVSTINRQYDHRFDLKVGDTIQVRLPQRFIINDRYDVRDKRVTVRLWS